MFGLVRVRRITKEELFWQGKMAPGCIYVEQEENVGVTFTEPDWASISLRPGFTFLSVARHHLSQVATLKQALDMTWNEGRVD